MNDETEDIRRAMVSEINRYPSPREMMEKDHVKDAIREEKICQARQRHGKPFAFESGATWKPRSVPLLTEWLQSQVRKETK